ncbi:DUF4097 family beta strand repeat-containing protein [Actinocorallia sp. B10E7]|uniref:DUF4097 family beta strand repeat-containing protein n=1 Tax=Actinocorallia sp. B10E7 TaxID=3153558 RepID=UPI00325E9E83
MKTTAETGLTPATSAKKRTGWRVGGILLTLLALLAGSLAAMDLMLASSKTTSDVYERSLTSLSIDLDNASVEVEPGPVGRVRVVRVLRWSSFEPKIQETWEGDTLRIKVRCRIEITRPCRVSYRLSVPAQTPLTVKGGGGDVTVRDLTEKIDVDLAGGDIRLENVLGDLDVTNVAGNVSIMDSRSRSVVVESTAGDTHLGFVTPPTSVDVRTTAGNLEIQVPRGALYFVDAESVAGSREVSVEQTGSAPHRIRARNDSGDLAVRYQGSSGGVPAIPPPPVK